MHVQRIVLVQSGDHLIILLQIPSTSRQPGRVGLYLQRAGSTKREALMVWAEPKSCLAKTGQAGKYWPVQTYNGLALL